MMWRTLTIKVWNIKDTYCAWIEVKKLKLPFQVPVIVKGRSSIVLSWQDEVSLAKTNDFRASIGVGLDYYQLTLIIQRTLLDFFNANNERITSWEKTNKFPSFDYWFCFSRRNNMALSLTRDRSSSMRTSYSLLYE